LFVFGCANQLPPSGGEDDTSSPKVLKIFPLPNSLNYSGNSISIEFDEYIDRRSFKDALFISPKPMGELNYNWSGKKVEIEFPNNLLKNTTYTFVVGKGLKDIRNNSITAPIQFAFSTGVSIDNGKINGKVYAQKSDNLMIFAYINKGINDSLMNPINKFPDFFSQVNENSQFYFNHLPQGKFRLFALKDNNKNLLLRDCLTTFEKFAIRFFCSLQEGPQAGSRTFQAAIGRFLPNRGRGKSMTEKEGY